MTPLTLRSANTMAQTLTLDAIEARREELLQFLLSVEQTVERGMDAGMPNRLMLNMATNAQVSIAIAERLIDELLEKQGLSWDHYTPLDLADLKALIERLQP